MLSKADAKRLAKLLSDPQAAEEVEAHGISCWVDYIDDLALELGFVTYDTQGVYAGYTSSEPSFPDNYIQFVEDLPAVCRAEPSQAGIGPARQAAVQVSREFQRILSASVFGQLDKFTSGGSATGVMPRLISPPRAGFCWNCWPNFRRQIVQHRVAG